MADNTILNFEKKTECIQYLLIFARFGGNDAILNTSKLLQKLQITITMNIVQNLIYISLHWQIKKLQVSFNLIHAQEEVGTGRKGNPNVYVPP